jgi:glycosyltransferase involved in cell wall biosynthesis
MLGRILNGSSCFFRMLFESFGTHENGLLVFNTNPALLSFLGFLSHKLRNKRYIVLVHDLWPELPANTGMIKNCGLLFKIIDYVVKLSFKYADEIIVLSNQMKEMVSKKISGKNNKIHIVHNWADAKRIFPVSRENNVLIEELGLRGKKIVMYSGNLGRYQPLEVMIEAANELKRRKDINFVFAGNGGKKERIQAMAASMDLENVIFIPFQSLKRLAESLSMADVSLLGIYPKNEGVIMPSKLYGLLAIGKPIICVSDPTSEVVEILTKSDAGIHSAIDDPIELAQKIVGLIDNPEKARKMGLNGRTYFFKHYERKNITKKWKEILNKILHSATDVENDPCIISSESPQVSISKKTQRFLYDQNSTPYISG